jgi:hypothetical protein
MPLTRAPKPAPTRPPHEEEDGGYDLADGDLSQLNSLLPSAEQIAAAEREAPPVLPMAAPAAKPLEYRRAPKEERTPRGDCSRVDRGRGDRIDPNTGELYDPMRDWIAPGILLAAGFAGIGLYLMMMGLGRARFVTGPMMGAAISIVFGIVLVVMLVKTLVLIVAAVPLAAYCDINVGLLRTAILKLASTILVGDTVLLWLPVAMRAAGMISKLNEGGLGIWIINGCVLAVVYHLCFWYVFRLLVTDFTFAALMAMFAQICDFFIWLATVAIIFSIIASRPQPQNISAIRAPITIAPGTPLIVQPGQTGPTAFDDLISRRIKLNQMIEGYTWCRMRRADDSTKKLVSDMYAAGADKVYMDGIAMFALLPGNPAKRAGCLDVAHAYRVAHGMLDDSPIKLTYQYAVIDLMGARLGGLHQRN